jgi:hypothetical protein
MMMQEMGPMGQMMEGGFGGMLGGGIPGGLGGGANYSDGYRIGTGGGGKMMSKIPQQMRITNFGGGSHRRHRRR